MSYRSLYRRQRPEKFSQMVGQEHVSRTLSQALAQGRVPHAYLFCGPRGTGKTTAAKILARALNCDRYPAPEPCGECRPCQNILAGVSLDVLEMDAASNRGIDEIRELRERTRYASGEGRFKVYIIDEAHMLTTEAFNAFLKTLEEPPPGVVFILATTDPSRLPRTIISRCQRFNFHLLSVEQVCRRLQEVAAGEGWEIEPDALYIIAHLAEGSMRDALGLLEQVQPYQGETITDEYVRRITGATRKESLRTLIDAVFENNLAGALAVLQEVVSEGGDLSFLLKDLTYCFSRLLLPPSTESCARGIDYSYGRLADSYREEASRERVMEAVELLYQINAELRQGFSPQFTLELGMIRLLRIFHQRQQESPGDLPPISESPAASPPGDLEAIGAELPPSKIAGSTDEPAVPVEKQEEQVSPPTPPREEKQSTGLDEGSVSILREKWPQILTEANKRQKSTGALLSLATLAGCRGNCLLLSFKAGQAILGERIMEAGHRNLIQEVFSNFLSSPVRIDVVPIQEAELAAAPPEQAEQPEEPISEQEAHGEMAFELEQPESQQADLVERAARMFNGKIFEVDKKEVE